MLRPVEITGDVASPGLVLGPLHVVAHQGSSVRRAGTAQEEANALERAIANATDDLGRLRTVNSGAAADILEFQVAMLADDALRQPAMLKIAAGEAADKAWRSTLDQEIAGYENSPDEYFRARASDLTDIRDRVLSHLSAGGAERSVPAGAVVLAADLPPSRFLEMDWNGGGLALWGGSISSHVAMLARARGIPMLVGMTGQQSVNGHAEALLDGQTGRLVLSPSI